MQLIKLLSFFDEKLLPWVLSHGIKIFIIIILAYIVCIILKKIIIKTVRIAVKRDKYSSVDDELKREETLTRIFVGIINTIIWLIAFMMILRELNIEIAPILAGAGIAGIAIGFGAQYIIKDVITGFFIILENQYRIGDVVKFGDINGAVEDISIRMTTLRDADGIVHHIPHGEIRVVSNLTKGFARVTLNVGVDYSSDIDKVIEIVNKTGQQLSDDIEWKDKIISPLQFVRVNEFADSSIIIRISGETIPHKQWEVGGEFRKRLKIAFDKEDIVIPYPHIVIHSTK